MSIQELEEFLGSIQKKIVEQESMIGKNIQSIAPLLYEQERLVISKRCLYEQERLVKQALSDAHSGECTEFVFDPKLQRDLLAD